MVFRKNGNREHLLSLLQLGMGTKIPEHMKGVTAYTYTHCRLMNQRLYSKDLERRAN